MSFMNKSCSTLMPSSKGRLTAASTHWMLYSGAKNPLVFLEIDFLNSEKSSSFPLSDLIFSSASLTFTKGLPSETTLFAKEIASFSNSASLASSSTKPISKH